MNYKLLLVLALALALVGCGSKSFTVKGNIEGLKTNSVKLCYSDGVSVFKIDSVACHNGQFEFVGAVDYPVMASLNDSEDRTITMFFLENSDISIEGKSQNMRNLSIAGSHTNDLNDTLKHRSKGITQLDDYLNLAKGFVRENPSSVVSAYALDCSISRFMDEGELSEYLGILDSELHSTFYVQNLQRLLSTLKRTAVGQPYMDFSSPSFEGDTLSLASFVRDDSWVYLSFWAGWNGVSRREMQVLKPLYAAYKDKGLKVICYSLDAVKQEWEQAIVEVGVENFIHISDLKVWESQPLALYGVSMIPANFLISPEGVIAAKNLSGDELIGFLETNL
ncbi:MAG: TlpA disulfide reductase family protein [Rikenellaceae bacterium]